METLWGANKMLLVVVVQEEDNARSFDKITNIKIYNDLI